MADLYGLMLSGFNSVLGAGVNAWNNRNARELTMLDRGLNYRYGEMAAENADIRTRKLYSSFYSPEALMRQYRAAGLSPSLMFDGTPGQGGMQGARGSGPAGPQTPYMPFSMLEAAQASLLEAQTAKTEAETKTIEGENERGLAEIANEWSESNYKSVAAALTAEQKTNMQWENYIKSNTADISINTAYSYAERAANDAIKSTFEVINAQVSAEVSEATRQAQIDQAIKNVEFTDSQILLNRSGVKLTEQKVKESAAIIDKWREELKISWKDIDIKLYNSNTERAKWKTMDESMYANYNILMKRLGFDQEKWSREFTWMIVDDAYNSMLKTVNTTANVVK